jgi:hypothetical protein
MSYLGFTDEHIEQQDCTEPGANHSILPIVCVGGFDGRFGRGA